MLFGAIAQRTHFCTMGAISDIVNMGDWTRMRMWGMAMGVAMIGFYGMAWLGWIDPVQTMYASSRVHLAVGAGGRRACSASAWCWRPAAAARRWCASAAAT